MWVTDIYTIINIYIYNNNIFRIIILTGGFEVASKLKLHIQKLT